MSIYSSCFLKTLWTLGLLVACSGPLPIAPKPVTPSTELGKAIQDGARQLLPEKPRYQTELPRLKLNTDPLNIVGLMTVKAPKTIRLEVEIINVSKISGVREIVWKITERGLPLVADETPILEQNGQSTSLAYTLTKAGRFRVEAIVKTVADEQSSAFVEILAF